MEKSNTQRIKDLSHTYLMNTYGERKLALVRGSGSSVWDADGVASGVYLVTLKSGEKQLITKAVYQR